METSVENRERTRISKREMWEDFASSLRRRWSVAYTIHEGYPGIGSWDWYNVTGLVGSAPGNAADDVCLVQILLSYLRPYVRVLQDPSLSPLRVDGICGPITQSYIDAYQSHMAVANRLFKPDGIVEPGHRSQVNFSTALRGATIVSLNGELFTRAPAAHRDIRTSLATPPILRFSLSRTA
jgi:hypothetical protein